MPLQDLELIFSRFDPEPISAEIIRDPETGDSLQYAFIEFSTKEACNEAYFKMNGALIDDRRIKVDFSQSVSKEWNKYRRQRYSFHERGTSTSSKKRTHQQISNRAHGGAQRYGYDDNMRKWDRQEMHRNERNGKGNFRRSADERRGRHHQDSKQDSNRNDERDHRSQRRNGDYDHHSRLDKIKSGRRNKYGSYVSETDSEDNLMKRNEIEHRERKRKKSRDDRRKRSASYEEKEYDENRYRSRKHSSKKHRKKSARSYR